MDRKRRKVVVSENKHPVSAFTLNSAAEEHRKKLRELGGRILYTLDDEEVLPCWISQKDTYYDFEVSCKRIASRVFEQFYELNVLTWDVCPATSGNQLKIIIKIDFSMLEN